MSIENELPPSQGLYIERADESLTASEPSKEQELPVEQPAEPEQPKEEVILNYASVLLNTAVNTSKNKNFSPVAFQFGDLELINQALNIAKNKANIFNNLAGNVVARDTALVDLIAKVQQLFNHLESLAKQFLGNK